MKKVIPLVSLLLATQLGNAQQIGDRRYFEISNEGEVHRLTEEYVYIEEESRDKWIPTLLERLDGYRVDTLYDLYGEWEAMEKLPTFEAKLKKLDEILESTKLARGACMEVSEANRIRDLFSEGYKGWKIKDKHEDIKHMLGRMVSYLAYQGLKDRKEEQERLAREGIRITLAEAVLDGRDAGHILARSLGGLNLSEQEIITNLQRLGQLSQKYDDPYPSSTPDEERGLVRIVSFDILNAFTEAAKKETSGEMHREFMQRVSNYPRVAVDPMALATIGEINLFNSVDSSLVTFEKKYKTDSEIYRKSNNPNEIDFPQETYVDFQKKWYFAYMGYDSSLNLLRQIYGSNKWVPKQKLINKFKGFEKSYNPIYDRQEVLNQTKLNQLIYDVLNPFQNSEELRAYRSRREIKIGEIEDYIEEREQELLDWAKGSDEGLNKIREDFIEGNKDK
jgi:hypothetical protein